VGPTTLKLYEIRPHYIREALEWLVDNNIHYTGGKIQLNFENLEEWASLNETFVNVKENDLLPRAFHEEKGTECNHDDNRTDCDFHLKKEVETEPSLNKEVLLEDNESIDCVKEIARSLSRLPRDSHIIDYVRSNRYVKPYEDSYFFEKSFVHLFPYGVSFIIRVLL
jgi:hypothetical protein